jgi:hypothetical protein
MWELSVGVSHCLKEGWTEATVRSCKGEEIDMEHPMKNHYPCYHGRFIHGPIQQEHMWLREEVANSHRTRPYSSFL